jgi:Tfp pilus assembly protein PilN
MLNINFVPDDYIEKRESCRANIFYLVLLVIVLGIFGGTFLVIKTRQRSLLAEAELVNVRLAKTSQAIAQLEELQSKRKLMMKTALMTAELIEPVPRSLLLAAITNSLPTGVSLTRLKLIEKEPAAASVPPAYSSKYEAAKAAQAQAQLGGVRDNYEQTQIEIEGLAPSDIEVAQYISRLGESVLLEEVGLVHSKEYKVEEERYRMFELTARLRKDVTVSGQDVESIKAKRPKS